MIPTSNRKPQVSRRTARAPEGLFLRALVISCLVRLGMLLLMPIGAVAAFFLPLSNRAQHRTFGFLFSFMLAAPVVLACALCWWAWLQPHRPGRSYRGLPILVAVMGLLIAGMPLPFDPAPSLLTYGAKAMKRIPVPMQAVYFTERIRSFFDACSQAEDCAPTRGGVPRRCAVATDGERMCVEITPRGCCPTAAGCPEGWVCVWLEGPSRDSRLMSGFDSIDSCVPAEYTSRFRELRPPPSCDRPRSFTDPRFNSD